METEVLAKIEEVDPVAAEEAQQDPASADHDGETSVRHARRDEFDDDEDDDNASLLEELLNGEDETYAHIQGKSRSID